MLFKYPDEILLGVKAGGKCDVFYGFIGGQKQFLRFLIRYWLNNPQN